MNKTRTKQIKYFVEKQYEDKLSEDKMKSLKRRIRKAYVRMGKAEQSEMRKAIS